MTPADGRRSFVPDGHHQGVFAVALYGYSGARSIQSQWCDNERLLARALNHGAKCGDSHYFLVMDGNAQPSKSKVILESIRSGYWYDFGAVYYQDTTRFWPL